MATYKVLYQFSFKENPPVHDVIYDVDVVYDGKCLAEVPISTDVAPYLLMAARMDFIDNLGMLAPFCLEIFRIVDFIKTG